MRKDAQAVLLLLIGGTLLKISISGTYVRYVKPGQLPLLVIAGVVLIAIAGVTLWQIIRAPREPAEQIEEAYEPSGFEHLADPRQPARQPLAITARAEEPAEPDQPPAKLSDLREPAKLSDLREPAKLSDLREPAKLSDLRDPSAPRALPAQEEPTQAIMLSALADLGLPEPQEVVFREFSPGELVAMPVNHHLVDRAAQLRRARENQVSEKTPALVQTSPDEHEAEDDAHVHREPRIAWLLLVPALALLLFAPPALGSYQASRNGTALSSQADSDFPPLPDGDPVRISLLDYAGRAVFDQGKSLEGRQVTLSGFVIAGPDGQPYLARMIVTCCAADARPVKVGLAGDLPTALQPDEWIEVQGSFVDRADKDPVNAELVPYIQVSSIHDIEAPQEQYES